MMADLNRVLLIGTIAEPRIGWRERGKPELWLNHRDPDRSGASDEPELTT
jgi:hypothetical protein